jgi:hypothetical protein
MKVEINEWTQGIEFTLKPETVEEYAQLLRFGMNANADKPFVYTSFGENPHCYIHLHKRKESVQKTSISPESK